MVEGRGPVWRDVTDALRKLAQTCNVVPKFQTEVTILPYGSAYGLLITLRVVENAPSGQKGRRKELWAVWPSKHHKTMPGLLTAIVEQVQEDCLRDWELGSQAAIPFGD